MVWWKWALIATICALLVTGALGYADSRYQRKAYMTGWPMSPTVPCRTVRTDVLIRDAVSVEYADPVTKCRVKSGVWMDPYSGTRITDPRKMDVDHVVPLGHVDAHGGRDWPTEKKRAYASDLGYARHLLAVSAHENRSKSDKGPDVYRPPAKTAWCRYAEIWSVTKYRWGLTSSPAEHAALAEMLALCPADPFPTIPKEVTR